MAQKSMKSKPLLSELARRIEQLFSLSLSEDFAEKYRSLFAFGFAPSESAIKVTVRAGIGEFVKNNMQGGPEQRKHRRYNLAFPVRVQPKTSATTAPPIETSTKDISTRGLHLVLSGDMEIESELDLEITLPAELAGGKSVKLRCRGKVARLEPKNNEGKIGVGAVIHDYEFFHEAKLTNQTG